MGLVDYALQTISEIRQAPMPPAVRPPIGVGNGLAGMAMNTSTTMSGMGAYGTVGWLHAVVARISSSVAAVPWSLKQRMANGDTEEVTDHPVLDLWEHINPFFTTTEFLEMTQMHLELTGKAYWMLLRNQLGEVAELWPIRPDRIRPIQHAQDFISGYVYSVGGERVVLEPSDVIFIRNPHPTNMYDGISPVMSILTDLEVDKNASRWLQQFFLNSARPGGVLEFKEALKDEEFEKTLLRWRQQHQGSSNAHRVAILEGATWKDVQMDARSMQLEELRKLDRDIIFGAFGVHASIMGVSESVNRANAMAARLDFAEWTLKPRLTRLQGRLTIFARREYDSSLFFAYRDPTPPDVDSLRREATEGWRWGYLTMNEARTRIGESARPDGDVFNPLAGGGVATGKRPDDAKEEGKGLALVRTRQVDEDPRVEAAELAIEGAWSKRLKAEVDGLVAALETVKIVEDDIELHNWDWLTKYMPDVISELAEAFMSGVMAMGDTPLTVPMVRTMAAEYAERRAGELLRVDGSVSMVNHTKQRVRSVVSRGIEAGEGLGTIARSLRDDVVFSRSRAEMVARTETATALGHGRKELARIQGQDEKRCFTQGDDRVDEGVCQVNEGQGWIRASDIFASGHDTIPFHPRCRCTVIYRTSEGRRALEIVRFGKGYVDYPDELRLDDEAMAHGVPSLEEGRCPRCSKYLGKNVWCPRCKEETRV